MATADHWFVDQKLCTVNFNGLIMQLELIFWKISSIFWLFLSKSTVEQIYAQTMKIGSRITFFLNISNLSKNYLIDFFILSQILVQVWYNLNTKGLSDWSFPS